MGGEDEGEGHSGDLDLGERRHTASADVSGSSDPHHAALPALDAAILPAARALGCGGRFFGSR